MRFASRLREWLAARWRSTAGSRSLPAGQRSLVALQRGERVLSVGRDHDEGYALVATDRALHHRAGKDAWSRLGWEQVNTVSWDAAASSLVVTGLVDGAPRRIVVPLRVRGTVPELVLERITHTRLGCWQIPLADGRHVLAQARRRPGTGELRWLVSCDGSGLDLADDGTREQVERAIARLGEDVGVPRSAD